MKLDPIKFGIALGSICAIATLCLGLMATTLDWGTPMVDMIGTVYLGYTPTFVGSIFGAMWAFLDCTIAGYLFAWIYNRLHF